MTGAGGRRRGVRTAALALAASLGACGGDDGPAPTSPEALANATYLTEAAEGGEVTLEEGRYVFAPGAPVSEVVLVGSGEGDLDGDGETDAAAVLIEASGLARILRLHALLGSEEGVEDVAARMLGDRFAVRSVAIEDGLVDVRLLTRRPGAPVQTPASVPTRLRFALTDRGLVPVNPPEPVPAGDVEPGRPTGLTGRQWDLVRVEVRQWSAASEAFDEVPWLRFAEELGGVEVSTGSVTGRTGCNRVFAAYEAGGSGSLRIRGVAATRRACAEDAADRERRLIAALEAATAYEIVGDTLRIALDGGRVTFEAGAVLAPPAPTQDLDAEPPPPRDDSVTRTGAARRQT